MKILTHKEKIEALMAGKSIKAILSKAYLQEGLAGYTCSKPISLYEGSLAELFKEDNDWIIHEEEKNHD